MKKKVSKKFNNESFGIIGLTLGILSIIFMGNNGILLGIVGLVFSRMQQKNNPTKIGKAGIIVNIVGIILGIVFMVIFIKYLVPIIQEQIQNFPAI
ncbi:DUF4190 domain-containing protein [Candidatus Pacearchaeota archaeon]|nr:DUF4190 domain-containing protein [Candidatus Pacearchaeota archaeon]